MNSPLSDSIESIVTLTAALVYAAAFIGCGYSFLISNDMMFLNFILDSLYLRLPNL